MNEIKSIDVISFLNDMPQKTSPRNRNNTRAALSQLYKILKNNHIVKDNIIKDHIIEGSTSSGSFTAVCGAVSAL